MLYFPAWWLIWLVVVVVFAVVRGVLVRKVSVKRDRERYERAARPGRPGLHRAGASQQSSQHASGQPLVTRDQLIAAGVITPSTEPDALPVTPIA